MILYTHNNKLLKINNKFVEKYVPPDPMAPVQIGTQIWSSKNLAIDDGGEGIYTVERTYGDITVLEHYYTLAAARRVASSIEGWHLPTTTEWETLIAFTGAQSNGKVLKSTIGWTNPSYAGTDNYGFCAYPAGQRWYGYGELVQFRSTPYDCAQSNSGGWYLSSTQDDVPIPVRLIKD